MLFWPPISFVFVFFGGELFFERSKKGSTIARETAACCFELGGEVDAK